MAYFMIFGSSEAPLVCERNLESSIIDTLNAFINWCFDPYKKRFAKE